MVLLRLGLVLAEQWSRSIIPRWSRDLGEKKPAGGVQPVMDLEEAWAQKAKEQGFQRAGQGFGGEYDPTGQG